VSALRVAVACRMHIRVARPLHICVACPLHICVACPMHIRDVGAATSLVMQLACIRTAYALPVSRREGEDPAGLMQPKCIKQ
jgi:hypothetical protein